MEEKFLKEKKYLIGIFCLFLVIAGVMTGCALTKKSKTLDEKLSGTVFSELNRKVDKKRKMIYENDKYAVQITDSIHGRGFYYCMLAAWPKDGEDRKIANNCNPQIGESEADEYIGYGLSQSSSYMFRSYYEDGITYICYSATYEKIRNDLRFRLHNIDRKSNEVKEKLADIYVAPKTVEIDKSNKIIAAKDGKVYQQSDGSIALCDGGRNFYISKLGIWIDDEKKISEEELILTYQNGKQEKIKRSNFGESGGCKNPYRCYTLWPSERILQVYDIASVEIGGKTYQLQ